MTILDLKPGELFCRAGSDPTSFNVWVATGTTTFKSLLGTEYEGYPDMQVQRVHQIRLPALHSVKYTNRHYGEFTFNEEDVVNPEDFIPAGESNPHRVRPWLIFAEFGTLAIAFADCEQDALDIAADAGKLNGYKVDETEIDPDTDKADHGKGEEVSRLGNAGKPYDLTYVNMFKLPNPSFSFVALFHAHQTWR